MEDSLGASTSLARNPPRSRVFPWEKYLFHQKMRKLNFKVDDANFAPATIAYDIFSEESLMDEVFISEIKTL